MRLYLIRHAQSTNNAIYTGDDVYDGHDPDPEITGIGYRQADRVAESLASLTAEPRRVLAEAELFPQFGLTHLYCSLMTRTILTATPIAAACGLPLEALGNTFERGGGLPCRGGSLFAWWGWRGAFLFCGAVSCAKDSGVGDG